MTATAPPVDPAALLARFEEQLRRYVARRVPPADADDVLQQVMLRIHLGVGGLRSSEHLGPWVFRVARNTLTDFHRRRGAAGAGGVDLDALDVVDGDPEDDSADTVRARMAACVAPFLEGLPPEQAEAIRLTDLGGMTQAAAAAHLGVPVATVKARVQRGRKRMRTAFELCCALRQDARGRVVEMTPHCGC